MQILKYWRLIKKKKEHTASGLIKGLAVIAFKALIIKF